MKTEDYMRAHFDPEKLKPTTSARVAFEQRLEARRAEMCEAVTASRAPRGMLLMTVRYSALIVGMTAPRPDGAA